jgi:hypothetical protein
MRTCRRPTRAGSAGSTVGGPSLPGVTSVRSARLVSNEAFRCIRAASSPADSGPSVVTGGFDPPPHAFQASALPTELHDRGAGPGNRTRNDWGTSPAPILLGPAGVRREESSGRVIRRWPFVSVDQVHLWANGLLGSTLADLARAVTGRVGAVLDNNECQAMSAHRCTSFQVVREEGVEPSSQGPKPCVLPLDDSRMVGWRGQWVPPPLLVGGSHACICQHLDPEEQ